MAAAAAALGYAASCAARHILAPHPCLVAPQAKRDHEQPPNHADCGGAPQGTRTQRRATRAAAHCACRVRGATGGHRDRQCERLAFRQRLDRRVPVGVALAVADAWRSGCPAIAYTSRAACTTPFEHGAGVST